MRITLGSIFLLLLVASPGATQCLEFGNDHNLCPEGCWYSGCEEKCYCTGRIEGYIPFLDAPHPGFFIRQESGRTVVSFVINSSPAHRAGILPGDVILRINERKSNFSCSHSWQNGTRQTTDLLLSRGGRQRNIAVELVPVSKLLATGWQGSATLTAVEHGHSANPWTSDGQFMLGLRAQLSGSQLRITDILHGSPAHSTGLRAGDRILAVDDVPVDQAGEAILRKLSPRGQRFQVSLTLLRGSESRTVQLVSAGISEILRALNGSLEVPPVHVASSAMSGN